MLLRKFAGPFAALAPEDRGLVAEALIFLCAIRLGLAIIPFPLLRRGLLRFGRVFRARHRVASNPARIAWAVRLVAARLRSTGTCLPQALCGQLMLGRRGLPSQVGIGVSRTASGTIQAHAWLRAGGLVLLGGPSSHVAGFTQIAVLDGVGQ